jgi:hypothetical protein
MGYDFSTLFGSSAGPQSIDPGQIANPLAGAAPPSQPATPPQQNPLLGAIGMDPADPRGARAFRAALGQGLSSVANNWNKPAGAAFAGGVGAALQGGAAAEKEQNQQDFAQQKFWADQMNAALDRAIKARAEGDIANFRQASIDIQRADQEIRKSAAARAGAPAEIAMQGQGSRENPYLPRSQADIQDIPAGTYYMHPRAGLQICRPLRRRCHFPPHPPTADGSIRRRPPPRCRRPPHRSHRRSAKARPRPIQGPARG